MQQVIYYSVNITKILKPSVYRVNHHQKTQGRLGMWYNKLRELGSQSCRSCVLLVEFVGSEGLLYQRGVGLSENKLLATLV